MKISFIVTKFPALSETFILNQVTGLLGSGHEVEIFAQFGQKQGKIHSDIEKYSLTRHVHYFNMPHNKAKRVLKSFYLLLNNFHKNPFVIIRTLNIFRFGKNALSLKLLFAAIAFLKSNKKFDIVHCHFGPNGILGVQLKNIGITNMIITTFHGSDMSTFVLKYGKDVYKNLFLKGNVFLPISNYWKKKLIKLGCDKKKIIVHHVGIDLEKFKFHEKRIQTGNPINILTLGRLIEKKGHEYAIRAVAKMIEKRKNIKYIIAGDGPLRKKLELLTSELKITQYVEFLGSVEQSEAIKLYQQAHIFVLPSVTAYSGDKEGTPTVLMEAQATGLPVISTFHSGIPEVVVNGESGFLVPERDTDALAEKIVYLIEHPDIWSEMGKRGREIVEKKYNIRKLNQELVNIYQNLIEEQNSSICTTGSTYDRR